MKHLKEIIPVVHLFQNTITRVAEMYPDMFTRSYEHIRENPKIHYLSCPERHLVLGNMLQEEGFRVKPVLLDIKRPYQAMKLGCALELQVEEGMYRLISANSRGEYLKQGKCEINSKIVGVHHSEFEDNSTNNWFSLFKEEAISQYDNSYRLKNLRLVQRRSSEKNLRKHLQSIEENKKLGRGI